MMPSIVCGARHTQYQPLDEEWLCPKCGAGNEKFYIEDSAEGSHDDCGRLHAKDTCYCIGCDSSISGNALAKRIEKLKNLVPCTHCAGTGMVKSEAK